DEFNVPADKERSPLTVLSPLRTAVAVTLLKFKILNAPAEIVCVAPPLKFTVPVPALKVPDTAFVQLPPTVITEPLASNSAPALMVTDPLTVNELLISNSPVVTTRLPLKLMELLTVAMVPAVFMIVRL